MSRILLLLISILSMLPFVSHASGSIKSLSDLDECINNEECIEQLDLSKLSKNSEFIEHMPAELLKEIILKDLDEVKDGETERMCFECYTRK